MFTAGVRERERGKGAYKREHSEKRTHVCDFSIKLMHQYKRAFYDEHTSMFVTKSSAKDGPMYILMVLQLPDKVIKAEIYMYIQWNL